MELTGIEIRNREILESLEREIRYFEEIRLREDIRIKYGGINEK